ncbi:uncharacterized protein K444DRAFT_645836 [Hyaloscypha bicolor E]|uniref:Dynamin GTPase domain-containing protein n=1 Tax=Hyaloscypha bicolor E TaxID=1095630 RepID=A0A2J6SW49_9HELO|nr:uncharacterized protein K444DRAFT_645836 [Hyaloscypha bicolor E]PMD54998.1 hypothetical protein K444DRAFT_645836 [Hyaloscypha bicolor E]
MVLKPFYTDTLNGLCSKDQLDLLDSIIVYGDQSSRKSSVLEAISGVLFPIKSNLCTRFPIELVLRKTLHIGVTVSIVPHYSRSESEQISLSGFYEKLDGFDGLSILIKNAKAAMAISTHGKAFSKDLLRIEVSGPDRPYLTIMDLPGLIHSETKQSIILAVISAKNDYANQIVLKLACTTNKSGNRTLGIIIKPDTLILGSESKAIYISLIRNQDVEFYLGWHVLKNMDSETGENLSRSLLGINKLRKRLSKVLLGQIATELPSLINEIEIKSKAYYSRLDNTYNNPFFEDAKQGYCHKIIDSLKKTTVPKGYLIRRTKGRELPGTFNPIIKVITRKYIEKVWKAAKEFLNLITTYIANTIISKYIRIIKDFFGVSSLSSVYFGGQNKDLNSLVVALVALKRFVDNIAIEVIKSKLISPLYDIFSPITVTSMPADLITRITGESKENRA